MLELRNPRLKEIPARLEIRISDLIRACSEVDWLQAEASNFAKTLLEKKFRNDLESLKRLAKSLRVSQPVLIRNLIACSDKQDLDAYHLLLIANRSYWKELFGNKFSKLIAVLPPLSKPGKSLKQVLMGKVIVSSTSLKILAPDQKLAVYRTFFNEIERKGERSRRECLTKFIVRAPRVFDALSPDEFVGFLAELTEILDGQTNCIERQDLDASHTEIRRAILRSTRVKKALFKPTWFRELARNPRGHYDSPESIQARELVQVALTSIANGKLSAGAIIEVLNDPICFDEFLEGLKKALQQCARRNSWTTSHKTCVAISELPLSTELVSLQFFATSYNKRAAVLGECPTELLNKIVHTIGAENIVDSLSLSSSLIEELDVLITFPTVKNAVIKRLAKCDLAIRYTEQEFQRLYKNVPSAIAKRSILNLFVFAEYVELVSEEVFKSIVRKIEKLESREARGSLQDVRMLKTLWKSGAYSQSIASKIMTQFSFNRELKARWLHSLPRETALSIGDTLNTSDVRRLLRSPHRNTVVQLLLDPEWRESSKMWRTYLKALNKNIVSMPRIFRTYLKDHPDVLREVFAHAPRSCLRLALSRLSLPDILPMAFKDRTVGFAVEERWSRRTLQSYIRWVQEKSEPRGEENVEGFWPPQISAAYQCALAFGLGYANYLVSLSRQVELNTDPAKRGRCFDHLYTTYKLPKKSGGNRVITAPDEKLKWLQRAILDYGLAPIDKSPSATGFRKGTSIVVNASPHTETKVVVNVDIEGFFSNTPQPLIRNSCGQIINGELSARAQILVAELCGYGGALPTGAPTSPAIANIILAPADKAIRTVCRRNRIAYTRYADDLTFSGNRDVLSVLPFVRKVLADYGYSLETKKTNIFRKGRRQVVTGLVVNVKPNLAKPIRKRIRAAVHNRVNGRPVFWHGKPMFDNQLLGRIAYLAQTQPDEAFRLRSKLEKATGK